MTSSLRTRILYELGHTTDIESSDFPYDFPYGKKRIGDGYAHTPHT